MAVAALGGSRGCGHLRLERRRAQRSVLRAAARVRTCGVEQPELASAAGSSRRIGFTGLDAELTDGDYAHMRKVTGYVSRHLAQRPRGDVSETAWRYSLMNWGHDPTK